MSVSLIKKERSGDDDLLELKVVDNGLGMDQAEVDRLFDDSDDKVLKKGTSGERSTGIGLTTVKYFTDLHNGKIDVESKKRRRNYIYTYFTGLIFIARNHLQHAQCHLHQMGFAGRYVSRFRQ